MPGGAQTSHRRHEPVLADENKGGVDRAVLLLGSSGDDRGARLEVGLRARLKGDDRRLRIDDDGLLGVARQYCGQLGKQDNCQVAVSLWVANELASLPIAFRLYLPENWAADPVRRAKAGVPEDIVFKTKPKSPSIRSESRTPRACRRA